jgi:hypothetical protein
MESSNITEIIRGIGRHRHQTPKLGSPNKMAMGGGKQRTIIMEIYVGCT